MAICIILYFYHSDCSLVAKLALKSAQVVFNYLVVCHCYLPLALFSLGKAKLQASRLPSTAFSTTVKH